MSYVCPQDSVGPQSKEPHWLHGPSMAWNIMKEQSITELGGWHEPRPQGSTVTHTSAKEPGRKLGRVLVGQEQGPATPLLQALVPHP